MKDDKLEVIISHSRLKITETKKQFLQIFEKTEIKKLKRRELKASLVLWNKFLRILIFQPCI